MPDLGAYAVPVLAAYGGSIAALVGIVWISLWRARVVARRLSEAEHG